VLRSYLPADVRSRFLPCDPSQQAFELTVLALIVMNGDRISDGASNTVLRNRMNGNCEACASIPHGAHRIEMVTASPTVRSRAAGTNATLMLHAILRLHLQMLTRLCTRVGSRQVQHTIRRCQTLLHLMLGRRSAPPNPAKQTTPPHPAQRRPGM